MLWEVDIHPRYGQPNREAQRAAADIQELNLADGAVVTAARGYLLQGELLTVENVQQIADELLADRVVEEAVVAPVGDERLVTPPGSGTTGPDGTPQSQSPSLDSKTPTPLYSLDSRASPEDGGGRFGIASDPHLVHVLPKPGVMDPVAQSALAAIADSGMVCDAVRTLRKYWLSGVSHDAYSAICDRVLANDAIEQVVAGPLNLTRLDAGNTYRFGLKTVQLAGLDDDQLMGLSREGQLYLQLAEMQTIAGQFAELGRDPTDIELESIAQTWSEHCSHKTLAGRIAYRDEHGERQFENMLKETIFAATQTIRKQLGEDDWCVSVFEDNAGVIRFDDENNLAFKVETHNHPSALEPYGGANTGIGGVIRDILGTGLGAKPIASTDVFCFAPPNTPALNPDGKNALPPGVLHPRRVMRGVVEGVRDYGNRMGIPTVNGAIYFDERYLGNPIVYCGSVGILPREKSFGQPKPGDKIVVMGGRTGRDGIHGATFSSAELTSESEGISGGSVQIGNAIEEKKVLDVLLVARDLGLYNAVTDCGAGGFSSAVGEMGEQIGAEVWLERAPLKYEGLSYTEIWISEAQERMVFAVPPENVDPLIALSESEGVEAFVLGQFKPTGRLVLKYGDETVGDLAMDFLHNGRPPVVREAVWGVSGEGSEVGGQRSGDREQLEASGARTPVETRETGNKGQETGDKTFRSSAATLLAILGSLNVASKEWVIRQYDHEVQGGSVVKPLIGASDDGPSDAAVVRPIHSSRRAVAIACGMNPFYGDLDPGHMAASAIDEAVRNCVAVGANPARIALLDNFCWGDCERPETLGSLVRAAIACHDTAVALGTPFISGKDSLNNEFSFTDDATGERHTIAIPATLLISAIGQIDDAAQCVTMDLKTAGNLLYVVGLTKNEMGGSHWQVVKASGGRKPAETAEPGARDQETGRSTEYSVLGTRSSVPGTHLPPTVDAPLAKKTFAALHMAIQNGFVRSCHDLSEGGLAVAVAEMCFAGDLGADIDLAAVPNDMVSDPIDASDEFSSVLLFSESNSRFLCEVAAQQSESFEKALEGVPHARVGTVRDGSNLRIAGSNDKTVIDADVAKLKQAWQQPLAW